MRIGLPIKKENWKSLAPKLAGSEMANRSSTVLWSAFFCVDEKGKVVVAFLNLGYDMKHPELVTLFRRSAAANNCASHYFIRTPIGAGPDPSQNRAWIGDPTTSEHAFSRSRSPRSQVYTQFGGIFTVNSDY